MQFFRLLLLIPFLSTAVLPRVNREQAHTASAAGVVAAATLLAVSSATWWRRVRQQKQFTRARSLLSALEQEQTRSLVAAPTTIGARKACAASTAATVALLLAWLATRGTENPPPAPTSSPAHDAEIAALKQEIAQLKEAAVPPAPTAPALTLANNVGGTGIPSTSPQRVSVSVQTQAVPTPSDDTPTPDLSALSTSTFGEQIGDFPSPAELDPVQRVGVVSIPSTYNPPPPPPVPVPVPAPPSPAPSTRSAIRRTRIRTDISAIRGLRGSLRIEMGAEAMYAFLHGKQADLKDILSRNSRHSYTAEGLDALSPLFSDLRENGSFLVVTKTGDSPSWDKMLEHLKKGKKGAANEGYYHIKTKKMDGVTNAGERIGPNDRLVLSVLQEDSTDKTKARKARDKKKTGRPLTAEEANYIARKEGYRVFNQGLDAIEAANRSQGSRTPRRSPLASPARSAPTTPPTDSRSLDGGIAGVSSGNAVPRMHVTLFPDQNGSGRTPP